MQSPIPQRIIQTGKSSSHPLRIRGMVACARLINPDFEYLFFDDAAVERFIDTEFPQYRALFDNFRYRIQRYDFFRYLAVYRHGGFYLDLDILLAAPLAPLCASGCVFPFEGLTFSELLRTRYQMDWEIGNFAFGAAAGHPFLEAVIGNCVRAQQDLAWLEAGLRGTPRFSRSEYHVLFSTGPGLVSRTLAENPELAKSVNVLFPEDVLNPKTWNSFGEYGAHLMEATWRPKMGRLRRRFLLELEAFKLRGVVRQSAALGHTRPHPYAGPATPPVALCFESVPDLRRSAGEPTGHNESLCVSATSLDAAR